MGAEEGARWRKVAKMLGTLLAHGVSADYARTMTHDEWVIVAKAAGVPAPSGATLDILRTSLEVGGRVQS